MVLHCNLVSHFVTEIWDWRCWHQKSWHFLSHFQSENGNKYSRWPVMDVLPRTQMRCTVVSNAYLYPSH